MFIPGAPGFADPKEVPGSGISSVSSAGVLPGVGSLKPVLGTVGMASVGSAGENRLAGGIYGCADEAGSDELCCRLGPSG